MAIDPAESCQLKFTTYKKHFDVPNEGQTTLISTVMNHMAQWTSVRVDATIFGQRTDSKTDQVMVNMRTP